MEDPVRKDVVDLLTSELRPPMDLQSGEAALEKLNQQADTLVDAREKDFLRGYDCFLKAMSPLEKDTFLVITEKLKTYIGAEKHPESLKLITQDDIEFLNDIATKSFKDDHLMEASCMFRFIIQLNPFYGRSWVGWAVCETGLNNEEMVEKIFELGSEFLPWDGYLATFAADFFAAHGQKDRARSTLEKTIGQLKDLGEEETLVSELNKQLASI